MVNNLPLNLAIFDRKAGAKDNGAAGERDYFPGYYAAFAFDPDGNNVEVVHLP